ncbi:MAG: GNAT family N-acetyltransferase [Ectothiorhodospiraceae bacterium]|nr:GNAT family N-acetyltransferase [Ectothiorhodospiraceae bacterium]
MPTIRPMTIDDHDALVALLRSTPGVTLRAADGRDATARYLARNPGLSFVATDGDAVVGCVLAGHDGRRGYLQHLVVVPAARGRGLGARLVGQALDALAAEGIDKTHIDVLASNAEGLAWWVRRGWAHRDDIRRLSFVRSGRADA